MRVAVALRSLKIRLSPKRFRRDENGAVAVEFGMVALPFFALLFSIIEISLSFFSNQILETAVSEASRLIMTGQAQNSGMTALQFRTAVCDRLPAMFDCENNLSIDVRTAANFNAADVSRPIINGALAWTPQFDPGDPEELVIVRAAYAIPVLTNFYGASLANLNDGRMLILASTSFRNEPYEPTP